MSRAIELFYIFFQGVVIFQALIFWVIYFLTRKKDVLFYGLFLCAVAVYFFINAPYTFFGVPEQEVWDSSWYDYVNTPVIIVTNLFYLLFHKAFFSDLTGNPVVKKTFNFMLLLMPVFFLLFIILTFFKADRQFIYYTVKLITVFPVIIVAYIVIKERLPFYKLIATGLICVIAGTLLTAWMDYSFSKGIGSSIFATTYPFFFIKLGLLAEMLFYLIALLKKWNYQEKQLAVAKLQTQLAVEKLRNRISGELHDDIGSTLSGIAMYSHLSETMLETGKYDQLKDSIAIIQKSANDVVYKLSDLVWAINPGKDSFSDVMEKLRQYGQEMCNAKNIDFRYSFKNTGTIEKLPMDIRQHLYLIVKEAVNNAVKYSSASIVGFETTLENSALKIKIWDDGNGFDTSKVATGNGILSMRNRSDAVNGKLDIESGPGKGTTVMLELDI